MDPIIIEDHNGIARKLGYLPPHEDSKRVRASRSSLQSVTPLIPQSQWKEVDWVAGTPGELRLDQLQEGACVGGSCAGANALLRYLLTGRIVIPSLWYIYDQINGGRDNGAVITDAQTTMLGKGAPPVSAYPKSLWQANQDPSGVPFYREDVPLTLASSAEAATALLNRWLPQLPIQVDNTFENFTSEGVAWGGRAPRGNASNHSIYLAGLRNLPIAGWVFKLVNSWNLSWGPFRDGTCYIPLAAIDNPASADDGWCHISIRDPDDTPPVPVVL